VSSHSDNASDLLVIPCYNCCPQIGQLINDLAPHFGEWKEIWFVDNGSVDGTQKRIQESLKLYSSPQLNVRIIQNSENVGLGGTHKAVFQRAAREKYCSVTVLHGDNQATVADALTALKKHKENPNRFILGTRFSKNSKLAGYSKFRVLYNQVMNMVFGIILKQKVHDLGSGLNLFPIEEVSSLDLTQLPNDLTFNIELLKWVILTGKEIIWLPITWREEGQISNVKIASQTVNTLKLCRLKFGTSGTQLSLNFFQSEIDING